MKKYQICFLGIFFFSLAFLPSIRGVADINYTFYDDELYSSEGLDIDDSYNIRNPYNYTGHYNATYSFENDTIGENPLGWTVSELGGNVEVIDNFDGHDSVLLINDSSNSQINRISNYFVNTDIGTFEQWINYDGQYLYVECKSSGGSRIFWTLFSLGLPYIDGGNYTGYMGSTIVNEWFHYRVDFNRDLDLVKHYINGINTIDTTFAVFGAIPSRFEFYTHAVEETIIYVDAIGMYPIDNNYTIGDNFIPYATTNTEIQEIDKFEFRFEALNNYYDVGDDNPSSWTDIENGHDNTNIMVDTNDALDRAVEIIGNGLDHELTGLEKEFNYENGIINITWAIEPNYMTNQDSELRFEVYSYDDTLIAQILLAEGGSDDIDLYYYNGTGDVLLHENLLSYQHDFSLFIDPYSHTVRLRHVKNGVYYDDYYFPLIDQKNGLGKIIIESYTTNEAWSNLFYIDHIGVYINGSSKSTEFAYIEITPIINPLDTNWNFKSNNLFYITAIGNISLNVVPTIYIPEVSTIYNFESLRDYSGDEYIINLYEFTVMGDPQVSLPILFIVLYNAISVSAIDIHGVAIIEGTSVHSASYSYGNILLNESFWWVSNETLYYSLDCDDANTEFLQISFNIIDLPTNAFTFMFTGYNFNLFGRELRFNYLGGKTSILSISYGDRGERYYFQAEQIFTSFDILITDDDYFDNYTSSGYFSEFLARPSATHGLIIDTGNFMTALIPLLFFILLPTFIVIHTLKRQGSTDETIEKMFLPILAVFTIIAYTVVQIQLWMLFLGMVAFATLFLSNRGDTNG